MHHANFKLVETTQTTLYRISTRTYTMKNKLQTIEKTKNQRNKQLVPHYSRQHYLCLFVIIFISQIKTKKKKNNLNLRI